MTPDETRLASAAAYFGAHGVERALICYSSGDAMLVDAHRAEFFAKLSDGECTFDDDTSCTSGWIEVANRRVYFTANAGMCRIRATNEVELSRTTSSLKARAASAERLRQAEIAKATKLHKRWERP